MPRLNIQTDNDKMVICHNQLTHLKANVINKSISTKSKLIKAVNLMNNLI